MAAIRLFFPTRLCCFTCSTILETTFIATIGYCLLHYSNDYDDPFLPPQRRIERALDPFGAVTEASFTARCQLASFGFRCQNRSWNILLHVHEVLLILQIYLIDELARPRSIFRTWWVLFFYRYQAQNNACRKYLFVGCVLVKLFILPQVVKPMLCPDVDRYVASFLLECTGLWTWVSPFW